MENKFEFTPKQWVLVRNDVDDEWQLAIFSHLTKKPRYTQFRWFFATTGSVFYEHCIPYNEETKHLLGTTDAYEEPYEPKEGDFITLFTDENKKWVSIYKGIDAERLYTFGDYIIDDDNFYFSSYWGYVKNIRNREISPATKEEKKMLLDALHKQGKDWDAEKKEIVNYKWRPKDGDSLYSVVYDGNNFLFIISHLTWRGAWYDNSAWENKLLLNGRLFKTESEAKVLCEKLNEAIKNVK